MFRGRWGRNNMSNWTTKWAWGLPLISLFSVPSLKLTPRFWNMHVYVDTGRLDAFTDRLLAVPSAVNIFSAGNQVCWGKMTVKKKFFVIGDPRCNIVAFNMCLNVSYASSGRHGNVLTEASHYLRHIQLSASIHWCFSLWVHREAVPSGLRRLMEGK